MIEKYEVYLFNDAQVTDADAAIPCKCLDLPQYDGYDINFTYEPTDQNNIRSKKHP